MLKINEESNELMALVIEDLQKPLDFLGDVRQDILRYLQIERSAFEGLSPAVS